jgi:hypothetical protein
MTGDDVKSVASTWVPWAVAVVFASAGIVFSTQQLRTDVGKLETELREHHRKPGHGASVTIERLLDARVRALEDGSKELSKTIRSMAKTQQEILRTTDAMCAAMGPKCSKGK